MAAPMYTNQRKAARNAEIIRAYHAGATMTELARVHGVCISRVSKIIRDEGGRLPPEERARRHREATIKAMADPETRAKIRTAITARWADAKWAGRRMILGDDPERREDYLALRTAYGAAEAKRMMGLAA